jgi:prevent-host-death family protein
MTQPFLVQNVIDAFDVRRKFGDVLIGIFKGEEYVVERYGKPVAALVPIEIYEQWKNKREIFFEKLETISRRVNFTPQKADQVAKKVVTAVRKAKKHEGCH